VHTEQSERVRLAESCSTPRDVYRKRGTSDLPRWCSLCSTNGYHSPENCPNRGTTFKPGDRVTRQGTVLSEARGMVWVRWDEGPKSCHLGAYLET
jgi:hypothetical protein